VDSLTIENIDIDVTLQKVGKLLFEEKGLSPAMRSMVELFKVDGFVKTIYY
jgi:transposase